ncbi:MAG: HIT family protein [Erysipelotrichaceae bacterium]
MCIFCEIVKGNIPSKKVYEDDEIIAILDIAQTTKGHTLVMPKKHYTDIYEADPEVLKKLIVKVQELGKMICENLGAQGSNILVNTDEVAGQSVHHLHFHIIPRYSKDDSIKIEFSENSYDLDEVLSQIKGGK